MQQAFSLVNNPEATVDYKKRRSRKLLSLQQIKLLTGLRCFCNENAAQITTL
jgi:hypothetical protein